MDRIAKADLSAGAAALLAHLVRVQRAERWHIASGDALAVALKVSRRSIVRYVGELSALGLLSIWKRKAMRDGQRVNIPSAYRVCLDALRDIAGDGFQRRQSFFAAKARALVSRVVGKSSCAKLAQQTRSQDKIRALWRDFSDSAPGSLGRAMICDALDALGEGEYPGQIRREWLNV